MKFELNLKERASKLSPTASKGEILCWIISNQQGQIQWWRAWAIGMTVTLITYVVSGRLILGTFPP